MTIIDDLETELQVKENRIKFLDIIERAQRKIAQDDELGTKAAWQQNYDLALTWWNDTIKPNLVWENTQTLTEQRDNILIDFEMVKGLLQTETDEFRKAVLENKLTQANKKFKQIKEEIRIQKEAAL